MRNFHQKKKLAKCLSLVILSDFYGWAEEGQKQVECFKSAKKY